MRWASYAVASLMIWAMVGGMGVAMADTFDENPACDSPSQGFERSFTASDGTSVERAASGLNTALERVGCDRRFPEG